MRKSILVFLVLLVPVQAFATNFWAMRILRVPEAREGWEYLDGVVRSGYHQMRSLDVRSLVYPNRKLADLYPVWILKTMIVIEHTGYEEYRTDIAQPILRVLKTFAREGREAFARDQSSAGAEAMAQFMPGSYIIVQRMYPGAQLPSFTECMHDHACQIRAMLCHFDAGRIALTTRIRKDLERRALRFALNIAAAYNAGGDRASFAALRHPRTWFIHGSGLPLQTRDYLWKFRRAQLPVYALERENHPRRRVRIR